MSDTPKKDRIGNYELIALIGDGAQGRVYKARYAPLGATAAGAFASDGLTSASASVLGPPSSDLSAPSAEPRTLNPEAPDDLVALKVVRITGEDEKLRLKFKEQADILRRLSHTNIVAYRDCFAWHAGEWDESQCLVMELLEGETLHERLKNAKTGLPWTQVEEIFEQCLAGLIHARERGITHRDLKPSNIFLTKDGKAKLIDFDIARCDDSGQMSTAGWKGTFDYMAPDFITINGFRGDEVSDVFSLGVCFYQALTGSLPFEPLGETAHIGYLNRWRDSGAPTPSFRPGVFRVLSNAKTLVARCLAARRDQRYTSFAAMLQDFRTIRYRRIRHKGKEEYELLAVLGRGGFGEVFKARRVSDGLLVAVKYLFSEKQSERFVKEAKILQQYPHPNLVKYVDFMVIEGTAGEKQFFLVMEFLEGMPGWTLRPRLKNEGKLEVSEAVPLFCAYLSALQFLHENARPIIHRDIKPGNLYAPVGQPEKGKIFDLGIARDVSGTVTVGGVPGTLDYMAPEFAEAGGDRGTPQSDLYALGLCLYEALAGKPVYDRLPTDLNSAWLAFQDRLRKPLAITFDAPAFAQYPRLKQIIVKALSDKPATRFRSAAEMRKELEFALQPASFEPARDDDGFDAEDVTMATFHAGNPVQPSSFSLHPSEPVTLGTRPLAPGDLPDAIAALRQGRDTSPVRPPSSALRPPPSGPRPPSSARRFVAATFIVALLAVAGGGAWYLKGPELKALVAGLRGQETGFRVQGSGRDGSPAVSVKPEPAAAVKTDSPAVGRDGSPSRPPVPVAQPNPEPRTPTPPVPVPVTQPNPEPRTLNPVPPPDEQAAKDLAARQKAAQEKADKEKAELAVKEQAARDLAAAEQAAKDKAAKDLADAQAAKELAAKEQAARDLAAAEQAAKDKAAKDLADAQAAKDLAAKEKTAKEVAAAAARLDALPAGLSPTNELMHSRTNELLPVLPALQTLATFTPATLADPGVNAKWTAARAACVARLEQAISQKDPLEQRAGRLKAVEDTLATPVAAQVLADLAPALSKSLELQKAFSILRLVNHGDVPVQVSAREFQGKVSLAGSEVKEWLLPVSAENLTVSVAVNGGNRFRSRIETIKLPRASGLERALTTLEIAKPQEPAAPPSSDLRPPSSVKTDSPVVSGRDGSPSRPPVPAPVTAATTPPTVPPVPATVQPSPDPRPLTPASSPSSRTAFQISVSPKNAAILLDDQPVEAGLVEVTPNKNHKISASCPGYKPVQQYYKASPGETPKIDLLLQKEPKKTLFGF